MLGREFERVHFHLNVSGKVCLRRAKVAGGGGGFVSKKTNL